MGIRTRSMRHTRSGSPQVVEKPNYTYPKTRRQLRQHKITTFTATKPHLQTPPPSPLTKRRPTQKSPATTTTTSSPKSTRPSQRTDLKVDGSERLPLVKPTKEPHTMRYLQDNKVTHLKTWLQSQTSSRLLLDPMTSDCQTLPELLLKGRRKTRAEDSEENSGWRKEIDAMSVTPVRPARGLVRKLSTFQHSEEQGQQPP